ncbi:MAG: hypothetical protein CW346_20165, partial [Bacillaceae bacterium]|nr:hypothetical protein [Bacillaceae bacterium]
KGEALLLVKGPEFQPRAESEGCRGRAPVGRARPNRGRRPGAPMEQKRFTPSGQGGRMGGRRIPYPGFSGASAGSQRSVV